MFDISGKNTIVNATEIQRDFPRVISKARKQTVIIIRNNEPVAAIISIDNLKKYQKAELTEHIPLAATYFIQNLESSSKEILSKIDSVILYGSYARNEAHKDSDIDLLILLKKDISHNAKHKILELTDAAIEKLGYEDILSVNFTTLKHWSKLKKAKALFAKEVERDGIILWKNTK